MVQALHTRLSAAALACSLQVAANAQGAPIDAKSLIPDQAHQAIFCGADAGDAGSGYAKALAKAISVVIDRKAAPDAGSAIKLLRQQLCPAASK